MLGGGWGGFRPGKGQPDTDSLKPQLHPERVLLGPMETRRREGRPGPKERHPSLVPRGPIPLRRGSVREGGSEHKRKPGPMAFTGDGAGIPSLVGGDRHTDTQTRWRRGNMMCYENRGP